VPVPGTVGDGDRGVGAAGAGGVGDADGEEAGVGVATVTASMAPAALLDTVLPDVASPVDVALHMVRSAASMVERPFMAAVDFTEVVDFTVVVDSMAEAVSTVAVVAVANRQSDIKELLGWRGETRQPFSLLRSDSRLIDPLLSPLAGKPCGIGEKSYTASHLSC
jgi:hypothetical protein